MKKLTGKFLIIVFSFLMSFSLIFCCNSKNRLKTTTAHGENNIFELYSGESSIEVSTWSGLQQQIDDATQEVALLLTSNIVASELDSAIIVETGKEIVIDLNGFNIDRNLTVAASSGNVICVEVGASLTIVDSSATEILTDGTGKITGGNVDEIDGNTVGGIKNEGELKLVSGNICGNIGYYGGGVDNVGTSAVFTMTSGCIFGNTANVYGGGVYNHGGATFVFTGGRIENNTSLLGGGGVDNGSGSTFEMSHGVISKNESIHGAGVSNFDGTFIMNSGEISENTATATSDGGGGVYNTGDFYLLGGTIKKNVADIGAGVLTTSGATMVANSGIIKENTAATYGGGIDNSSNLTINGCEIKSNTAGVLGGGIYHQGGKISVGGNAKIESNSAGEKQNNLYLNDQLIYVGDGTNNNTYIDEDGNTQNVIAPINMQIYISLKTKNMKFTDEINTDFSSYILSDDESYEVVYGTDKKLQLKIHYYIQNDWASEDEWYWQKMTEDEENVYSYIGIFGSEGVYVNTKRDLEGATWFAKSQFLGENIETGDSAKFVFDKTSTPTLTIEIAKLDVVFDPSYTWNGGNEITYYDSYLENIPNMYVNGAKIQSQAVDIVYYVWNDIDWQELDSKPYQVGNYKVLISIKSDNKNYVGSEEYSFEIKRKSIEVIWTEDDFVYDGTNQISALNPKYKDVNGVEHGLSFHVCETGKGTVVEFKDAGSYDLIVDDFLSGDPGKDYYIFLQNQKTYQIKKKAITVLVENKSKIYGEEDPTFTFSSVGVVDGDSVDVDLFRENTQNNVGSYQIFASQDEWVNPNYSITFVNGTLTINKKPISVKAENKNKIYGSVDPEFSFVIDTGTTVGGDVLQIDYERQVGENVGNYSINPKSNSSAVDLNYQFTFIAGTLEIQQKEITIQIDNKTSQYGTIVELTGTSEGFEFNDTVLDASNLSTIATTTSDVGSYAIIGENKVGSNYIVTFVGSNGDEGVYTIEKATNEIFDLKLKDWVYGSTANNPEISAKFGDAVYSYSQTEDGEYVSTIPSEIGKYFIKATIADTLNYSGAELKSAFIINQRACDVEIKNENGELIPKSRIELLDAENGIVPDAEMVVRTIELDNATKKQYKEILKQNKVKDVCEVLDIKLEIGDLEVQPNGKIKIKLKVPENILGKAFKILHIHKTAEGDNLIQEVENVSQVDENGCVSFEVDSLSEFVFALEKTSETNIVLIVVVGIAVLAGAIITIVVLKKKSKK